MKDDKSKISESNQQDQKQFQWDSAINLHPSSNLINHNNNQEKGNEDELH